MANQGRELYEFGPFRLDPEKRLLLRNDEPVPLQLKAFDTLLVLVRHSQQVVLKDELMKAVWPDTFVEESNLAQNIFVLRKTLAANSGVPDSHRFIATIPGRGYRFAENVRLVSDHDALVVQRHAHTHVLIEEKIAEPNANAVTVSPKPASLSYPARLAIASALVVTLPLVVFLFRPADTPPRVTGIHQITHIGTLVHNTHLLTDGPRIYFRVWHGKERDFASVSTEGGEVSPVEIPIPQMDIDDISPAGSEFLVESLGDSGKTGSSFDHPYQSLWRVPVPTGSPRPTGLFSSDAAWSPDGRTLAFASGSGISQANIDGTHAAEIVTALPDQPFYLRWAPDSKRLRFSAGDSKTTGFFLWEADLSTHSARKLIPALPSSARPWPGGWTPDGQYFFYTAVSDGTRNIYAIREKSDLLHRSNASSVQLTNGPFTFYLPLPGKDGKRLFVVGEQLRGALLRYDSSTSQFLPYAQSISADQVAFSPDGQWMAYVQFPECTLVRSRTDGSQRLQLTYAPMRAFNPQWSPDGTRIAFHAVSDNGAPAKIYLISSAGGVPALAAPPSDDRQIYPSWTSDGNSILFSNSDVSQARLDLSILDLKARQVSTLPGTRGLFFGQISPDGHTIVAVDYNSRNLVLYSVAGHATRVLAELADYPRWSRDGKFVYFNHLYFSKKRSTGGICRWNPSTNAIESLLKFPEFLLTGAYGVTFSLTPEGSILLLKDVSNRDLYALDLDLP
ncbi:MAG TPA: winged helix-turn-helix domain-containing protein [Candidatus Sulfotelmatobacter sp.]|nr:winged helix-turn-helix domain-containing protein [Candidatus Sulfotelmatobacter sp.]